MPRDSSAPALPSLVAGLLAVACLALAAGCGILLAARRVAPEAPATASPFVSTRAAGPTPSPGGMLPAFLLAAEAEWREGDPQAAIDLLTPALDEPASQAELQLGRSSLAGARFEQAYELEPTVERLYGAALGHDLGGDLDRALDRYMELVSWDGEKADPYRDFAMARIDHLRLILGTPSPQ